MVLGDGQRSAILSVAEVVLTRREGPSTHEDNTLARIAQGDRVLESRCVSQQEMVSLGAFD